MKIQRGSESKMQAVLDSLQRWADINNMSLNTTKTKDMWICFLSVGTSEQERLKLSNVEIERVPTFKLLGAYLANKRLHYLRDCRKAQLPSDVGTTVYCTKIHSLLEYASPVWVGLPEYLANEIQRVQNRSLDIIGVPRDTLPALEQRRDEAAKAELQRILADKKHPNHAFIKHSRSYNFTLRSSAKLSVPVSKTTRHMNSFLPGASRILTAKYIFNLLSVTLYFVFYCIYIK